MVILIIIIIIVIIMASFTCVVNAPAEIKSDFLTSIFLPILLSVHPKFKSYIYSDISAICFYLLWWNQ